MLPDQELSSGTARDCVVLKVAEIAMDRVKDKRDRRAREHQDVEAQRPASINRKGSRKQIKPRASSKQPQAVSATCALEAKDPLLPGNLRRANIYIQYPRCPQAGIHDFAACDLQPSFGHEKSSMRRP